MKNDLHIVMGTPEVICHLPGQAIAGGSNMLCLANGDIVVPCYRYEGEEIAETWAMVSSDGGHTWRREPCVLNPCLTGQTSDGSIILMAGTAAGPAEQPGAYTYRGARGKDTWASMQPTTITVRIPAIDGMGDDSRVFYGIYVWSHMIEMPNGELLTTAYGYFDGDDVPIDFTYEPFRPVGYPVPGYNKTRVVILKSTDGGQSWDYTTTMAYDPDSGEEGPCEPSMAMAKNGDLVCIMRTGRVNALRISRSADCGATWSPLQVVPGVIGVAPDLIAMKDGTLACAYGLKDDYWQGEHRRELRVMFSFDHGYTWPLNEIIYAGEAGSYPAICEPTPGELLASFNPGNMLAVKGKKERLYVCTVRMHLKPAPVYKWE